MCGLKDNQRVAIISGVLALLTLAIFWQVRRCDFVNFDDNLYITENPHVKAGLTWDTVKWAFESTKASNWHPLTWISHALDYQLYGLRPAGHHLTNLLFHVASTALLFIWLWRLTGTVWRSALVAALFAWHPLHVESVAWVAERKDVLSTFFLMLALLSFQQSKIKNQKSKIYYGLALLFFVLGLLAKPMIVTLPFILLLVDFWTAQGKSPTPISKLPWKKWVLEKIPFFVLSIASCVVTFYAQKSGGAVESFEHLPFGQRLGNAVVSYFLYICKMLWPVDLAIFYPQTTKSRWEVVGAGIVLLGITFFVINQLDRRRYLAVGWFWFLGTLVPVIGLVQVGGQSMADRYAYVPLIGLFIMLAWGLAEFAEWSKRCREATAVAALALIGCGAMTWQQTGYWRDSESLFKHDIEVTGPTVVMCSNLGAFLMTHNKADEALSYFNEALRLAPSLADAHSNVGFALVKMGKLDEGIAQLQKALELDPNQADAHFDMGTALLDQGKNAEAISELREAARLRPGWIPPHHYLSSVLARQGDLDSAVNEMAVAAQMDPVNPDIQNQLAMLLSHQGKADESLEHYRTAVRLYRESLRAAPDLPPLLNNFAWLLATNPNAEIRNGPEAVAFARRACEVTGWKYAMFVGTLAAAQAEAGQFDEAAKTASRAREIALAAGDQQIAARNEELSKLYQAGKAYHESN